MDIVDACNVCGKDIARYTCKMCGRNVCGKCFDHSKGACSVCSQGKSIE